MSRNSSQSINGKAFEYALLHAFFDRLSILTNVNIITNAPYLSAKRCFDSVNLTEQEKHRLTASFAVNFLIDLEPCLSNGINEKDIVQFEIASDKQGQLGDVRDVLAIRALQKWEIGVSAKNNHRAVKHSRLSNTIDFGEKWLGIHCSENYFCEIKPIFDELKRLRDTSKRTQKWDSLGDYHTSIYLPILNAFRKELLRLNTENTTLFAEKLVEYLIGKYDFYKVIKSNNKVEIQAYNIHGSLNLPFKNVRPKAKVTRVKLPSRLIEIVFLDNSKTTLLVTLNEGWQISFRLHNASSKIESSLKFDINLISAPHSLFTNHLLIP